MSDFQDGELQFRCKLCQFTGSSKAEIAEHFLNEHTEVEVVSPNKSATPPAASAPTDEKEDGEKEAHELQTKEKPPPKKRGRPRGKSNASYQKLSIQVPKSSPAAEDGTETLGRGMRKRKAKVPFNMTPFDDDKLEELSEEKSDDGHKEKERLSEEEASGSSDEEEEEIEYKVKSELYEEKPRRRGRPRKRDKESDADRGWIAADDFKSRRGNRGPRVKLAVSNKIFSKILLDRVREWQKNFEAKNKEDMFVCENESCRRGMSEAELDVHTKCHVPNMEGFRCFICQFMCLHWRNMRHHYRKVHDQMLTKVACDYELCTKEFPRIAALRSHVTMIHIKPPLTKKLSSPDADLSEFSTYLEKKKTHNKSLGGSSEAVQGENQDVENDDDEEEEEEETPRKRGPGRPPKRKRPVGRPPKHEDPPKKRATYAKRLRGEDREKFQSRLVAFVCDVCHAKYNQEDVMLSHKYAHFREESEQIHCTECSNFVAESEDVIRLHMSTEHKHMLQLHRCDKCNFSSNRYHDLKKHRIVHTGAKDYMCDKCGKCTTTPYNLKVHYRRMHATDQEKNIKCISCEYRCADKAVLKDHIRQKHGLLINGDEYQNPRAMLLFPCTMCPYVGRKQSSLDYHMRIHKENRQFKCHMCPYASKTKNNLVLHIRTHEGMQPVKCPHCDFRGATNKIISEHVMCKHAKARPYQCNICHWTTAYSGNMWKHVDTHQKELGDKMPEFPVSVISTDGHSVPTPLRAPSGKKRANKAGGVKLKVLKGKNRRQRTEEQQQGGLTLLEDQGNVQSIQVTHVQPDDISGDGVVMHQVPVATVMHPGHVMVAEGLSEEEAIGSTALSKLAAAVASAQEVHIISTPHPGMDNGANAQAQVIATQIAGSIPTSIQVSTSTGIQEIVEYTVPSVAVSQQVVDSAGNMTHIISDHLYHANQHNQEQQQHHHHQQQQHHQQQLQQQQQHHQQHANGGSIQQAAIHAGIPTVVETVPTAVVEQIVQDTPHPEDQSVQQLVATMIPHEAELVMSMMQSQHVQHVQHLQQPNVSQ